MKKNHSVTYMIQMYISYNIAGIYLPIVGIWICVANSGEINPIYQWWLLAIGR
jgi:hypothetical protein